MQTALERSERARVRRAIRVRGTVQGVGFRPMVHRVACREGLGGFVRNDADGVEIEVEGDDTEALAAFVLALRREAPPLARIDTIDIVTIPPRGEHAFSVLASGASLASTRATVPPDAATCDACARELFDPRDRRHRYPFVNCTDCGPRYTIIRGVPYDRDRTTMDVFEMCAACRAEYEDPGDRRFHAEPTACPACGPQVTLVEEGTSPRIAERAIARAVELLAGGAIVALKGLGGYQLAVLASNDAAVRRLRERKHRPDKPFALMGRDLEALAGVVHVDAAAREALTSASRPIVLLAASPHGDVAPSVAPALSELGVMLPATPLHHLLLAGVDALLVMTSGNVSDEPIAKDDDEAVTKLGSIADAILAHDRAIHTRADDSVVRIVLGAPQPVRHARGQAPSPVSLPFECPPLLAVGAELKSAICFARGSEAFLSQHIGDLSSFESRAFFEELTSKLGNLLGITPVAIAHDLHPDYASTRWALARGVSTVAVQHHHAHIAACLAEHGRTEPVIGVAFDGTGCGPLGEAWGGEVLLADLGGFVRVGHLQPIALAGGEAAIREPWRLALAALVDAGEPPELVRHAHHAAVRQLLDRDLVTRSLPRSTGAGRWFDAFAALAGVRETISYEAQAPIELDALACSDPAALAVPPYPFEIDERAVPFVVDFRPTVRALVAALEASTPRERIAAQVYATMAHIVAHSCRIARRAYGASTVALSGGCFQSALLTRAASQLLEADGFEVLIHRRVPPNDGGLALGQAAVAGYRLMTKRGDGRDVPRHPG